MTNNNPQKSTKIETSSSPISAKGKDLKLEKKLKESVSNDQNFQPLTETETTFL